MKRLAITLILLNLVSCMGDKMPKNVSEAELIKSFSMVNREGDEYSFKIPNEKKLSVLFYFATWCPDCHKEIPYFKKVVEEFKGNNDVQFMGVRTFTHKDKEGSVEKFIAKFQPNFPIFTDPICEENFPKGRLSKEHNITWVPTVKLITAQGEVTKVKNYTEYEAYVADLTKLISEKIK